MRRLRAAIALGLLLVLMRSALPAPGPLDLRGYADESGAISVLHRGDSADPYFALQALLLAQDNEVNVSPLAEKFADWLAARQKPDGTFDRYCRSGRASWTPCKTADADDALLAMWIKLLETMPALLEQRPAWKKSYATSVVALEHLYQPSRGIYMVSPVFLHGLLMDNLEVWSYLAHSRRPERAAEARKLAQAIHDTFWNPVDRRFLVSTQLEQRSQKPGFYPEHVAQLFPLLVDFPLLPAERDAYYRDWMREHRTAWLAQGDHDYPWGLIAVLALRQNDLPNARCWMAESRARRHSARWAVTDEVAWQILSSKGLTPAAAKANCRGNPTGNAP